MKVLIIEDDDFKARRLSDVTLAAFPDTAMETRRSVNSGLKALQDGQFDLLLLDMSLTTFDVGPNETGGRPRNFGGLEVLGQLERFGIELPVIVITQFERFELGKEHVDINTVYQNLKDDYPDIFVDLIYYNSAEGGWEVELVRLIQNIKSKGDEGAI